MRRIGLYVRFRARPGQRDALAARLLTAAEGMAGVAGCELYVVNTAPDEPDTVWVTEVWRSAADHEASLTVPGTRAFIEETLPLMAGPPERIDTTPLGGVAWGRKLDDA